MSEEYQNVKCHGNGLVALVILGVINVNYYISFDLTLAEMSLFAMAMYMLPAFLYSLLLSFSYYAVGFRGVFHSIVTYSDGSLGFNSSDLPGDIVRLFAFLAITFWPTYAFVLASDATGVGLSDSYFTHIWQYTLFFMLLWLFFFAWVANGLFTAAFVYGVGGIFFYLCTRVWDFALYMTADAETWWGKGLGIIAAFIFGWLMIVFVIRFYTQWMRYKVGIDD